MRVLVAHKKERTPAAEERFQTSAAAYLRSSLFWDIGILGYSVILGFWDFCDIGILGYSVIMGFWDIL
jgi:hypothetical protein